MLENGAIHQVKDIVRVAKSSDLVGFLGMDTMNFGLARAGSPWYYPLIENEEIDKSKFHLIGGISTFVNVKTLSDGASANNGNPVSAGEWRLCFAVGGALSVFLARNSEPFKGTEF